MDQDIKLLLKYQEIDSQIYDMEQSKESIPREIEEIVNVLADKKAQSEFVKSKNAELEKAKKTYENEIRDEEERIKRDKERLMQVKTNEEYHALLREIDNSRKEISERETNIIKILDRMDQTKKETDDIDIGLANLEKEMNAKKEELDRFLKGVDGNIASKKAEMEELAKGIKASLLKRYIMIKERKDYREILTKVNNYTCGSCNMHIPPQMVNEVRAGKHFHICPTCERILYWGDDHEKNS